jgi:stage II sporulation protein AA (anti-sigma F factor antagonist)
VKGTTVLSESFEVTVVNRNGRAIVYVRGEIDVASCQEFRAALLAAQTGAPDVIVDLSAVTFMDSSGINALIGAYRRASEPGSLHVVSPTPAVRRVFEITGMSELLLVDPPHLTWRQVTYHTSGWRQWMTEETTDDGGPVAEIIEVGPRSVQGRDCVRYALESGGETTLYESLDEAMQAAEYLGALDRP